MNQRTDETVAGPTVYVIATPIGNRADLSPRALSCLSQCDILACEDTRHTGQLLKMMDIKAPELVSYHDHSEAHQAEPLLAKVIRQGLKLGVVSDAGTPCIADPGYRLIAAAHREGVRVVPIPGPSALAAIISASGIPSDRVEFVGFLPTRSAALCNEIERWLANPVSVVCFEAARRLPATLDQFAEAMPGLELTIGRELSKTHEGIVKAPIALACAWSRSKLLKGEVVMMLDVRKAKGGRGVNADAQSWLAVAERAIAAGASRKDVLALLMTEPGMARKDVYKLLNAPD